MEVIYTLIFHKQAIKDSHFWKISGNKSYQKKIDTILSVLEKDPYSLSPGETEKLKYTDAWSRRINKKDRITYIVNDEKKEVVILRMRGHYEDK